MFNWSSNLSQLAHQMVLDNSPSAWLYAALALLLTFTVLPLVRGYLRARRLRYANRDLPLAAALLANLADHTSRVVLWIVALYAADRILTLPASVDQALHIAIVVGAGCRSASGPRPRPASRCTGARRAAAMRASPAPWTWCCSCSA
jgi:hypothetical protein